MGGLEEGLVGRGAAVPAVEDGWVINGPRYLEGARVSSHGDHRVAMALAVAGLIAEGRTEIDGAEGVGTSCPDFFAHVAYRGGASAPRSSADPHGSQRRSSRSRPA